MDLRLHHNSAMIVVGPSQSGKTVFVDRLLHYRQSLFDQIPQRVRWYYGVFQPSHSVLKDKGYEMIPGLADLSVRDIRANDVIVLDDLMQEAGKSNAVTELFTRIAHHKHCMVILLTQNLFQKSKDARTQSLNAHYLVLMKNPRDKYQIVMLGRQILPGKPGFLSTIFQEATVKPYSYLFVDLHQSTPEQARCRDRIFPDEWPMRSYVPKV